jgi:hypothetical protein
MFKLWPCAVIFISIMSLAVTAAAQSADTSTLKATLRKSFKDFNLAPSRVKVGEALELNMLIRYQYNREVVAAKEGIQTPDKSEHTFIVGKDFTISKTEMVDIYSSVKQFVIINKLLKTISVYAPRPIDLTDSANRSIAKQQDIIFNIVTQVPPLRSKDTLLFSGTKLQDSVKGQGRTYPEIYTLALNSNSKELYYVNAQYFSGIYANVTSYYQPVKHIALSSKQVEAELAQILAGQHPSYVNYTLKPSYD